MAEPLGWVSFYKPKDDWYYLGRAAQEELLRSVSAIRDKAVSRGARRIGSYKSRGQTSWARFDLWEFPALDVLTDMVADLEEAGYYQYFAESNSFGRRTDEPFANYMAAGEARQA